MPAAQRREPLAVIGRLLAQPHRFAFFQAVRLVERWLTRAGHVDPLRAGRMTFRNSLDMSFPASEVSQLAVRPLDVGVQPRGDAVGLPTAGLARWEDTPWIDGRAVGVVELTPAFFGLLGAHGALPVHYTERLIERETRSRDPDRGAARAFYDIFQHRATVMFYGAWRKHRLDVEFEADRHRRALPWVLALAGVGHDGLRRRLRPEAGGVADDAVAFFAGTLQRRPISAAAVQRVLQQYLGVRVQWQGFIGHWYALSSSSRTTLGGANARLGAGTVLGGRVWQRDLRARLTLGPLTRAQFIRLLPGGPGHVALRELLRLMTGPTLEYEVRLGLLAADVRGSRLDGVMAPRLGWDSFLLTRASTRDRLDATYELLTND